MSEKIEKEHVQFYINLINRELNDKIIEMSLNNKLMYDKTNDYYFFIISFKSDYLKSEIESIKMAISLMDRKENWTFKPYRFTVLDSDNGTAKTYLTTCIRTRPYDMEIEVVFEKVD